MDAKILITVSISLTTVRGLRWDMPSICGRPIIKPRIFFPNHSQESICRIACHQSYSPVWIPSLFPRSGKMKSLPDHQEKLLRSIPLKFRHQSEFSTSFLTEEKIRRRMVLVSPSAVVILHINKPANENSSESCVSIVFFLH
jgi:hypothetical protein